jgi:hypothetical protein
MQFFQLSLILALAASAIATPIQLEGRSPWGCYKDVAATQGKKTNFMLHE